MNAQLSDVASQNVPKIHLKAVGGWPFGSSPFGSTPVTRTPRGALTILELRRSARKNCGVSTVEKNEDILYYAEPQREFCLCG